MFVKSEEPEKEQSCLILFTIIDHQLVIGFNKSETHTLTSRGRRYSALATGVR